jgi:hypothetical protein
VVYNLTAGVAGGSTFALGVNSNLDVDAEGLGTQMTVPVSGAPVWGGEMTVKNHAEPAPFMGCSPGAVPGGPAGPFSLLFLLLAFLGARAGTRRFLI